MTKTMLTKVQDLDKWESECGYPLLKDPVLAHDSKEWLVTAKQNRLALLDTDSSSAGVNKSKIAV